MVNSAVDKTGSAAYRGWFNGLLGVVIFSGSLPATRIAVLEMSPFSSPFCAPRLPVFWPSCCWSVFANRVLTPRSTVR